ncbi:MAG: ATP-binding protein [Streptomyces sp.]|nr:ATP-binding protein [Streptomyces sp.]
MTNTDTTTMTTSGPVWDWAAGHGPVTGALSATTGMFAVATTGTATGMPPGWALAVGAAGAVGHTAAGIRLRNAGRTITARASSWLIGAGWTTWAMTNGPLTFQALGSLAVIGVGIGTATRSTNLYEEAREEEAIHAEERAVAAELSAERRAIAEEWVDRIRRVCGITVRVLAVEHWATGTGFTIDAELPGGTTYDKIAARAAGLSADAHLPHGCTATAGPGIHQGRTLIDVATVNALETETHYPADYSPLSILTGIPWGYRSNAEQILTYLREQCALVVGPTGSGKTNMVHNILAGFARATDALTFVIDLNAGSAGLSWVLPALQHQPAEGERPLKPGIDWLAGTVDEAHTMLDAVLRIGKQRKIAYQSLMAREDTDLLPIGPTIPQIMLVVDEGAEILVSTDRELKKLAAKILEVIRLLRAMGVRTVLTALGATGAVLGNLMIRREAKVRVALTGGEKEGMDLSKLFPGTRGLTVEQAPYKGAGFMGTPESPAGLFKCWRILPSQIREIVAATSERHPVLDAVSVKAAGEAYTRRWDADRIDWMHNPAPAPTASAVDGESAGRGLNLTALRERPEPRREERSEVDRLADAFMQQIDKEFGTTTEPGTARPESDQPRSQRPGLNLSALRDDGDSPSESGSAAGREGGPDWLADAIAAIADAGAAGMKPSAVADLVGRSRQAVRDALKAAAERGELVYRDNGPHSVYVHPDHA